MHVCCSASFILPPVQAISWCQLTEVPRDAGPQFNFHFTVSANGVDRGRGEMMLHLRSNHFASFLLQKWGLQHLMVHGWEAWVTFQIPGSAWLAPMAPWQTWHEEHLGCAVAPATYLSSCAAPGLWQQTRLWELLPGEEGIWRWRQDPVICHWGSYKIYVMLLHSESLITGMKKEGERLFFIQPQVCSRRKLERKQMEGQNFFLKSNLNSLSV